MKSERKFKLHHRAASFSYAFTGIQQLLQSEHNSWIHLAATVLVVSLGIILDLTRWEWISVVIAMAMVWSAEALNTAFEFLCDVVSPDFHPLVEKSKNIAAAAVLICAIGAATIGILVFMPHLLP